jgi:hypothetical protein
MGPSAVCDSRTDPAHRPEPAPAPAHTADPETQLAQTISPQEVPGEMPETNPTTESTDDSRSQDAPRGGSRQAHPCNPIVDLPCFAP